MAHVYISYAPDDVEYAEWVQQRLERANFSVWIDTNSTEVPAGSVTAKDWRQEIDEAIRTSFVLLTIVTPQSRTFEYVSYEWMFALGVGIPVIPLVFQATELPQRLKAIQPLDFTKQRRQGLNLLLERVTVTQNRAVPSTSATGDGLRASGKARTLIDLVDIIRSGSYEQQREALAVLAEVDPAALVRLMQNALKQDDLRIPFMEVLIDRTLPPMRHVFMSYSRQDLTLMRKLRDDLRQNGLNVWSDESLTPGEPSWQIAIQDAIDVAGCMIVILSPDSCRSKWVLAEIQRAEDRKLRILPLLMRGQVHESVPLVLNSSQHLDLRSEQLYSRDMPRFTKYVESCLRKFDFSAVNA